MLFPNMSSEIIFLFIEHISSAALQMLTLMLIIIMWLNSRRSTSMEYIMVTQS